MEHWDAVVVGAGLTGSWVAKELCESGCDVLLIDAGPLVKEDLFGSSNPPRAGYLGWRVVRQIAGQALQIKSSAVTRQTHSLYVNDRRNPYDTAQDSPFLWLRGRQVGGRGHTWGRVVSRFDEADFIGWPFGSDEIEPYYREIESTLDVSEAEGAAGSIDCGGTMRFKSSFVTTHERELLDRIYPVLNGWKARRLNVARYSPGSYSPMLSAAAKTGKLTLRPHTVAEKVLTDPVTGYATAVNVIDCLTGQKRQINSERVFLSASTIETVRLLLNSRASNHPMGLGNSTGLLGVGVMDHVCTTSSWVARTAVNPPMVDMLRLGQESGVYLSPVENSSSGESIFGVQLYASQGGLTIRAFGEMESRLANRVSLSERCDSLGVPIAKINVTHSPRDNETAKAQRHFLHELMRLGSMASPLPTIVTDCPGSAIHECGGAPIGTDRKNSVVDPLSRIWYCPNVWVCDGACLPRSGYKNPSLTLMAMALRAARKAMQSEYRSHLFTAI